MKKRTTCILGASGNIGKLTVKLMSEKYSRFYRILAGSRDPDTLRKAFGEKPPPGVEFIKAGMD